MVLRRMIEAMEPLGVEVKQISVLGGGSKSDVWCQLKADATYVPNPDVKEVYDKLFENSMKPQNGLKVFYEDSSFESNRSNGSSNKLRES